MATTTAISLVPDPATPSKPQSVADSNARLIELADGIKTDHAATITACLQTVERAISCGEKLTEAKSLLKHGKWESWVSARCGGMSMRTAQLYMKLAHNKAALEGINTISDAARVISSAGVKDETEPPIDPAIKKATRGTARRATTKTKTKTPATPALGNLDQIKAAINKLDPDDQHALSRWLSKVIKAAGKH